MIHNSRDITMKKKMISGFPTLFTHTISIYHYDVMLAEIIQIEIFTKGSLGKESQPQRSPSPPNALSRERGVNIRKKNHVKGFDLKKVFFFRASNKVYHLGIALLAHPSGIQNIEERGDIVHLPIMHQPGDINVPMNLIIANTPKVSHHCIPIPCKAK
jgi:hypothetical protein